MVVQEQKAVLTLFSNGQQYDMIWHNDPYRWKGYYITVKKNAIRYWCIGYVNDKLIGGIVGDYGSRFY